MIDDKTLIGEFQYWSDRIREKDEWGASLTFANEQLLAARKELLRRRLPIPGENAVPPNPTLAILSKSDDVRLLMCGFKKDAPQLYAFKTRKVDIEPGDICVVTSTHGFGYAFVEVVRLATDEEINDMLSTTIDYKWIVDVVDVADYKDELKWEEKHLTP